MQLRITKTTDGQHLGEVIETPATEFGQLSKPAIQALASEHFGGQFSPTSIAYSPPKSVRLVSSNYSVTLERIDA